MGSTCSNASQAEQEETFRKNYNGQDQSQAIPNKRSSMPLLHQEAINSLVKKYVISQSSSKTTEIIIELSNGSIESIPVKTSHPFLTISNQSVKPQEQITHCADTSLFFTNAHKVYYMHQFNDAGSISQNNLDQQFMSIAHAFNIISQKKYLLKNNTHLLRDNEATTRRNIRELQLMIPIENMYLLDADTQHLSKETVPHGEGKFYTKDEQLLRSQIKGYRKSINESKSGNRGLMNSKVLLIESIPLISAQEQKNMTISNKQGHKIVDLFDLGLKMGGKKICWQDRQFAAITRCVFKKLYKLHHVLQLYGVSNIILGTDGGVHLLGIFRDFNAEKSISKTNIIKAQYERIKCILLASLLGKRELKDLCFEASLNKSKEQKEKYEEKVKKIVSESQNQSQFEHPQSISLIRNIDEEVIKCEKFYKEQMKLYKQEQLSERKQNPSEQAQLPPSSTMISQPSIKFIRDYIEAYFYKLSRYSPIITSAYLAFRDYETARQILLQHIYVLQKYDQKVKISNNVDRLVSINFIEERGENQRKYVLKGESDMEVLMEREREKREDQQIYALQKAEIQILEDAYICYQQLVSIEKQQYQHFRSNSTHIPHSLESQYIQSINTLSLISYYLGIKYSQSPHSVFKQYSTARQYFEIAVMYVKYRDQTFPPERQVQMTNTNKKGPQPQKQIIDTEYEAEYYVKLIELLQATNISNTKTNSPILESNNGGSGSTLQQIMIDGVTRYPQHKALHLMYIIYLCDCLRVNQAQKHLLKAIHSSNKAKQTFTTLEHEICQAKILITKALMNEDKFIKEQKLREARQNLEKVVIEKYTGNPNNNKSIVLEERERKNLNVNQSLPFYYEVMGDLCLITKQYMEAKQYYHTAAIYHKKSAVNMSQYNSSTESKRRLFNVLSSYPSLYKLTIYKAAEANALMLLEQMNEAETMYKILLSNKNMYITPECRVLYDSIRGNYGILKIKQGNIEEGCKVLQMVLAEVVSGVDGLMYDYNYVFLNNILMRNKKRNIESEEKSEVNRRGSSFYG